MLTLVAVQGLASRREQMAWIALAAAVLFKGYAIALVPLFLLYRYRVQEGGSPRARGPRRLRRTDGVFFDFRLRRTDGVFFDFRLRRTGGVFFDFRLRRGGARWWRGPLAGALFTGVILLPVLVLGGQGFVDSLLYHAHRGLEIESIYASVILVAHQLGHLPVSVTGG